MRRRAELYIKKRAHISAKKKGAWVVRKKAFKSKRLERLLPEESEPFRGSQDNELYNRSKTQHSPYPTAD